MIDPRSFNFNRYNQGGYPTQGSLFPSNIWQGIGDIFKVLAASRQQGYEDKQKTYKDMLAEAKNFGLPGLRKLYGDSKFQSLSKELGIALPSLPELSPTEIKDERVRKYYARQQEEEKKMLDAKRASAPGQEVELTAEDRRKIKQKLAAEFQDIAGEVGLPTEDIKESIVNTIIRATSGGKLSGEGILAFWSMALQAKGLSVENMPLELKQSFIDQMNSAFDEELAVHRAQIYDKLANAALKDTKRDQLISSYNTRMSEVQAKINNYISQGKYRDAVAEIKKFKADSDVEVNAARIESLKAQTGLAQARTDEIYGNTTLSQSKIRVNDARAAYYNSRDSGPSVPKLQLERLKTFLSTLQKHIASLRKYEEDMTISGNKEEAAKAREEIANYQEIYNNHLQELEDLETGKPAKPTTEPAKPGAGAAGQIPTRNPRIDVSFANSKSTAIYNGFLNEVPVDQWEVAWNQLLTAVADRKSGITGIKQSDIIELFKAISLEYYRRTKKKFMPKGSSATRPRY